MTAAGHHAELDRSYRRVGDATWRERDFVEGSLQVSRDLFTPESLSARQPRPKRLEVYALLAGLPFPPAFVDRLEVARGSISEILGDCSRYWVAPANLGVEFCVFKWPTDTWNEDWLPVIRESLRTLDEPAFRFDIGGIQINPDGCVVAKGFDEDEVLFRIRERVKGLVPFLPARQSAWAHVPLGRILEPLGAERFARLRELIARLSDTDVASTRIESVKLVHETRWYMEEKTTVEEFFLRESRA